MHTLLTEAQIFAFRIGSFRSILLHLALLAAFGVWVPRMKGLDFLDSQVLAAYACLGLIFAAPAAAQAFSDTDAPSFQQAKARIFVAVLYGEVIGLALLGAGIATVYWMHRGRYVPTLDWPGLAKSVLFGLGATAALASMAAWLTVKFSRRVAMICLRLAFFGLLVLYFYRGQSLEEAGLSGAVAGLAAAGLFVSLLKKACR